MNSNKVKIEISTATILKIIGVFALVWFLYAIREIVVLFFVVLVIVAALGPLVDRMSKHIPRVLSVVILFLAFLGILTAIGFLIIPPIVNQIGQLANNLPFYIDKFGPILSNYQNSLGNYQEGLLNISSQLSKFSSGLYTTTVGFISGLVGAITILILSFYMLLEQNALKHFLHQTLPLEHKEKIFDIFRKIGEKMGGWFRGQILLMIVIGALYGIALPIVGVPYALTLAVWGGLTEVIPYVGPWLGLVPALIIAFTVSPLTALIVLIIYLVIQQLESQFLAPKIMGKAVGLSPVIIILALLAGAKLMGVTGMIIAVPAAGAISVLIQEWLNLKKIRENA